MWYVKKVGLVLVDDKLSASLSICEKYCRGAVGIEMQCF